MVKRVGTTTDQRGRGGRSPSGQTPQVPDREQVREWAAFPGGELEGERPRLRCPACRQRLNHKGPGVTTGSSFETTLRSAPLCFQCYRADLDRKRAFAAAGQAPAVSPEHFQYVLPLEPVNRARLAMLKAERRSEPGFPMRPGLQGAGAPRLAGLATELRGAGAPGVARMDRGRPDSSPHRAADLDRLAARRRHAQLAARRALQSIAAAGPLAVHAAELQLPESWLPFVLAR